MDLWGLQQHPDDMMSITLFISISYPSQNQKSSFKYAGNTSKHIQPHDIDAINLYYNIYLHAHIIY